MSNAFPTTRTGLSDFLDAHPHVGWAFCQAKLDELLTAPLDKAATDHVVRFYCVERDRHHFTRIYHAIDEAFPTNA